jgi:hypothetical protein
MSHFTVLCIGENVKEQLDPFYELECTMDLEEIKNDSRAEFVQKYTTEELEKDFLRIKNENPEYYYESLEDFAEEWHGIDKLDGEEVWGCWTNPNSKWDWYSVGGRWTGFFKIKDNPQYPDDIEIGDPGLMTDPAEEGYADSIRLCDIDFEGMKKDLANKLSEKWDKAQEEIATGRQNILWLYGIEKDDTKESYIERNSEFSTYALIKDGQWYEKGKMGWWGISNNENENWKEEFQKLIKSLPQDTLLTVVDCHI